MFVDIFIIMKANEDGLSSSKII